MASDLAEVDYEKFWRRLQQVGLNAYEARSYLVLVGHPRFKALELAARARVPRQKIYEVLDSLVEKGFAQVVQNQTLFRSGARPGHSGLSGAAERESGTAPWASSAATDSRWPVSCGPLTPKARAAAGRSITCESSTTRHIAVHYRSMLSTVDHGYIEFSRAPYAVDPLDEQSVKQAALRGVRCRILIEGDTLDDLHRARLDDYRAVGIEVKLVDALPMKLAVFDETQGLVALLDPVITRPAWTAVVFDHSGFAQAMCGLFEERWRKA